MQRFDVVTNLHLQVEELLQIGAECFYAGIELDLYWDPLALAGGSQLERVRPRQDDRSLRSIPRVKGAWNLCGAFIAQIPGETIHARGSWQQLRRTFLIGPLRRLLEFVL